MSKKKFIVPKSLDNNVRIQSVKIIYQVRYQQGYSNLLIQNSKVKDIDRNLLAEIVYGTLSDYDGLMYQLSPFIKGKKVDDWVEILLLTAIFQMTQLDKIPTRAVIYESVEIAKKVGNKGIANFVNGVLRNISRKGVRKVDDIKDINRKLQIKSSMPQWLINDLIESYGQSEVEKMIESLKQPSHVSSRITDLSISNEKMIEQLKDEGFDVRQSEVSPCGIVGEKGFLAGSQKFLEGKLTIQDESSMLVAPALDIKPDHLVLDACSAPGGKTTHIASYLDANQGGKVIALDIHQHKLDLVEQNVRRMNLENVVETKQLDARDAYKEFDNQSFDRILVDAPCSGLGIIRRKPEIKFNKTKKDIENLNKIQLEILESLVPLLKPGGKIIYSTCTIVPEENYLLIEKFLKNHPEFGKIKVNGLERLEKANYKDTCVLLPHMYHTDGFFISCLQKRGE